MKSTLFKRADIDWSAYEIGLMAIAVPMIETLQQLVGELEAEYQRFDQINEFLSKLKEISVEPKTRSWDGTKLPVIFWIQPLQKQWEEVSQAITSFGWQDLDEFSSFLNEWKSYLDNCEELQENISHYSLSMNFDRFQFAVSQKLLKPSFERNILKQELIILRSILQPETIPTTSSMVDCSRMPQFAQNFEVKLIGLGEKFSDQVVQIREFLHQYSRYLIPEYQGFLQYRESERNRRLAGEEEQLKKLQEEVSEHFMSFENELLVRFAIEWEAGLCFSTDRPAPLSLDVKRYQDYFSRVQKLELQDEHSLNLVKLLESYSKILTEELVNYVIQKYTSGLVAEMKKGRQEEEEAAIERKRKMMKVLLGLSPTQQISIEEAKQLIGENREIVSFVSDPM